MKGRGNLFPYNYENVSENIYSLRNNLHSMSKDNFFNIISFDNLAVNQLNVKSFVSDEDWNKFYMGDDGSFTYFVDLVNMEFAKDSMTTDLYYIDNKDTVQMFQKIRR